MSIPRPIGYWHYPLRGQEVLPDPHDLARPNWISPEDKARLVAYLKGGATYETWRGLSHCRFRCGIDHRQMGCRDFTDGVWVWPEGLYHYVEKHDVMLPDEFVAHCRALAWLISSDAIQGIELSHALDHSAWIKWARAAHKNAEPAAAPNSRQPSQVPPSLEIHAFDSQRMPSSGGCG